MSTRLIRARIQAIAGRALAVIVVLLLANSLFLYSVHRPEGLVGLMMKVHVWLGYALCGALLVFFVPHYAGHRRHSNTRAQWLGYGLLLAIVVGAVLGIRLAWLGKSPATATLVRAHELAFVIAMIAYLGHRLAAYVTPVLRYELAGVAVAIVLFVGYWGLDQPTVREAIVADLKRPAPSTVALVSNHPTFDSPGAVDPTRSDPMPAAPADSYGSSGGDSGSAASAGHADMGASHARTVSGRWLNEDDLRNPQYCGQCHTEIFEQWSASVHRFSSQNDPFYEKTFAAMQRHRSPEATKFCGGCHDPLILLTGNMNGPIDRHSTNAQEGITCLLCHGVVEVQDRIGNANYVVAAPDHYPFYGSDNPDEQEMNRRLIRSKPEKHKESFLKPHHRTAEFCLTCHKTHLDERINHYRWRRGPNDFDAWHDSAAGMKSALTFYNGEKQQRCQDCHMKDVPTNDPAARDGLTRDHTWGTANTALALLKDKPLLHQRCEELLKDCVRVDIFSAIAGESDALSNRIWPLERPDARLRGGDTVRVEVVVRNLRVGHLFPTGTIDLNEPWLEFAVSQADGPPLLSSGWLDETGRLDPSAHRFNLVLLTREGRLVDIHNVEEFHTVLYNNAIPLGQSDVMRYEFTVPSLPDGSKLRLSARLHYRKFSRQYTEFALGPDAPEMPIILVAEDQVDVTLGPPVAMSEAPADNLLAERVNDFGVAHLRQGDTRTARWAFERVAELKSGDADAWVNMARCYLTDGALEDLETVLRRADELRPGYHKTAYFLGRLRAAQGRYDEAIRAYDVTLAAFPEDREVLNQKGAALFKQEQFTQAVGVFEEVLRIDPENVSAHSYLFRAHATLGDADKSRMHERRYLKYQPQEAEKPLHEIYRRNNPDANREATAQHVHPLSPPPTAKPARDRKVQIEPRI